LNIDALSKFSVLVPHSSKNIKMPKTKQISEAPESSAGDDFHVLWTMKKSFELLNFDDDGLKAITVEGVVAQDNELDSDGSQFLGVDIAEYYGGENFRDAKEVTISQLKYSTRRVGENWTFAKLYEGKKTGFKGSIIHRLAQAFKIYLVEFGRDSVQEKLTFKLVSNRSFNEKHQQYLNDFQDFLRQNPLKTYSFADVVKQFPSEQAALKKLHSASTLPWSEFSDFIQLVDLADCGTGSRLNQKFDIVNAISKVAITSNTQFKDLYFLTWQKMMPEAQSGDKNKITKEDLLNCFGFHSLESLFPVYQKFEQLENLIERVQLDSILDTIINNDSGYPICLHGGAGIGKSTLSQSIKQNAPKDSEVILFDCYGEGAYLNSSDNRHLHKEALLHISNEMAKTIGSPFLLIDEKDPHIFIREFNRRCETAVKILKSRNPNSVLILIIDAADNSVTAAQKNQTNSFVQDLLNEPITEGVRLVVTSRTHRLDSLHLPAKYIDIPLQPFQIGETQKYLTHYFPESTETEIQEFHDLTEGIPRVQSYVLGLKKEGIVEVINYLKPNGKKVEDLIEDKIYEAGRKLGIDGKAQIDRFFTYLITLPRPVPIDYLAALTSINEGILIDFTTDIWHGLILKDKKFSFRDEDFENYVRSKYKPREETRKHIADLFLQKAETDAYASVNLGVALYEANDHETLINVVLTEGYLSQPTDPLRNKEVYIERTKLAMKVSSAVNDNPTFFKLAFITADVAKTDMALKNLLISNADIAALFGNTDSLHKRHLQSEEKSWSGSFHYQLAAIYARELNIELAKKHLKNAGKWIDWMQRQKDTDSYDRYRITNTDIAFGAEAYLRIYGSQRAFKWLNSWSPKDAVFHATHIMIHNVLPNCEREQITEWLSALELPLYAKLLILNTAKSYGIDCFDLKEIADTLIKMLSRGIKFEPYLLPPIINFCELLIKADSSYETPVKEILSFIKLSLPERVPTFTDRRDDAILKMKVYMRKATLLATFEGKTVKKEDIYPESLTMVR
jgi:hypothetical protein